MIKLIAIKFHFENFSSFLILQNVLYWKLMSIILATWEAKIRKIMVPGQSRLKKKKFARLHPNGKILSVVALTCCPSSGRKFKIGGLWSRSTWTINKTLAPK
jgi:hypothetical protein